jgi:hypothetical protein
MNARAKSIEGRDEEARKSAKLENATTIPAKGSSDSGGCLMVGQTKKQALPITTRTSDNTIGIRFNNVPVVTITKSGRKARIVGTNLAEVPERTHSRRQQSISSIFDSSVFEHQ